VIATKKYGEDVYKYFRRREQLDMQQMIASINGKTWSEAADALGVPIPLLFTFLEHVKRIGLVREVRIK